MGVTYSRVSCRTNARRGDNLLQGMMAYSGVCCPGRIPYSRVNCPGDNLLQSKLSRDKLLWSKVSGGDNRSMGHFTP